MSETKGRCPLCINHRVMDGSGPARGYTSLSCNGKFYTFPSSNLYYCHYHGWFLWTGNRHVLFDFAKNIKRAKKVEPLGEGVYSPTLEDYRIIKMNCSGCGHQWKQYDKTWLHNDRYVICPKCEAKIPKEEAKKDEDSEKKMTSPFFCSNEMCKGHERVFSLRAQLALQNSNHSFCIVLLNRFESNRFDFSFLIKPCLFRLINNPSYFVKATLFCLRHSTRSLAL